MKIYNATIIASYDVIIIIIATGQKSIAIANDFVGKNILLERKLIDGRIREGGIIHACADILYNYS